MEDFIGIGLALVALAFIFYWSYRDANKDGQKRKAHFPESASDAGVDEFMPTPMRPGGRPILTVTLIVLSLLITFDADLGKSEAGLLRWIIATPESDGLSDVLSGQVWRLVTPIFLHFGPMHLLFNMLWLWDLGGIIERRKGRLMFGAFIVVVGVLSNLVQYFVSHSPFFGGMSGVVYGLLGYFWIQGRLNPRFGYVLNKQTVIMMLGWYFLCWTGLLGPVANWAHTAGLLAGMAWAYAEYWQNRPGSSSS